MLLRSFSTPLWNSGISHNSKNSAPEPEPVLQMMSQSRSCSEISLSSLSMGDYYSIKKTSSRALWETLIKKLKKPLQKCMSMHASLSDFAVDEKESDVEEQSDPLWLLSNSGLKLEEGNETEIQREMLLTELMMDGGSGGGGKRIGCGGGGDENEDDSEYGGGSTDLYYKKMIEANPGNSLLLCNYARYLKEVRADLVKAEEYCERAVMATPDDGNILSLYAELKWQIHKDPILAENYFHQSVKAGPENCYVLASYAHFLWDAEVEVTDADYSSISTT